MAVGGYGLIASLDAARGELVGRLVALAGLEPLVTRDGAEAERALLDRGVPGLVVTELSLPRADGFSLLQALRAIAGPAEAPALVVNGFGGLRQAIAARKAELGIAAILDRDAGPHAIDAAIKRALEQAPGDAPALRAPGVPSAPRPPAPPPLPSRVPEEAMAPIASDVRRELGVPVVVVALLAGDRVLVPVRLGVTEELFEILLFGREVADAREVLVIPDASGHPLFAAGPTPSLRGYAAVPVITARGEVAGILCVGDDRPLGLGPAALDRLAVHARRVAGELERMTAIPATTSLAPASSPALASVLAQIDAGALLASGGRLVYANPALASLVDVSPLRLEGMGRNEFVAALAALARDPADATQRIGVEGSLYAGRADLELLRPRRRLVRWTARPVAVAEPAGETFVTLELFTDVTAEVDLERERDLFARADWLTGLANRRGGEDAIAREVARARRLGGTLCFALFDADELGAVNDRHGPAVGDDVVRDLAAVMRAAIRGSDVAIRWGGDELLVVLPGVRESGARVFAERVRKRVEAMKVAGQMRVTVSVGVSELDKLEEVGAAIGRADARMFQAKRAGRNRIA